MSKPAGRMIRSCLGKARRLTFPGLKSWAVFRSSFGRLEYTQENVQTAEALRAWLLSACPSGTKAIRPSKRHTIILALRRVYPGLARKTCLALLAQLGL